jgi:hypothetical protein
VALALRREFEAGRRCKIPWNASVAAGITDTGVR